MCIPVVSPSTIAEALPRPLHRKRVAFEEDPSTRNVKRRVLEYLPLSEELTQEEKQERWMQVSDRQTIATGANAVAQECRISDAFKQARGESGSYTEAYATLYASSRAGLTHESAASLSPRYIATLALSDARGLEDRVVPQLALERRFHRIRSIRSVVQLQQQKAYDADHIRAIYEAQSKASRDMSETLGMADATAAMLAYAGEGVQPRIEKGTVPSVAAASKDEPALKPRRPSLPLKVS